jgi:hypothetical protein
LHACVLSEEVGCQAHGDFICVRELLGIYFPSALVNSYKDLTISIQHFVDFPEGKWDIRRTIEKRRGTLHLEGQYVRHIGSDANIQCHCDVMISFYNECH